MFLLQLQDDKNAVNGRNRLQKKLSSKLRQANVRLPRRHKRRVNRLSRILNYKIEEEMMKLKHKDDRMKMHHQIK